LADHGQRAHAVENECERKDERNNHDGDEGHERKPEAAGKADDHVEPDDQHLVMSGRISRQYSLTFSRILHSGKQSCRLPRTYQHHV
jgi:hypothetical protein